MASKNKFTTFIKKLGKSIGIAIKDEIDEIKELVPTEEDYQQGEKIAVVAAAAMASMGVPVAALGTKIMAKAFAYGIRDMKDGIEDNDKLIVARIINELKNPQ
ncbi:MAG: hypothetical protein NC218_08210 [Acetobacter sp.]|nr:hypothetical protein [Acetobacter sp.]